MIVAEAAARSWSLRRATVGAARAPRQSRTATTTARIVQCSRKAMTKAVKPAERGSPSAGISGSAYVQARTTIVISPSPCSKRRGGGSKAVLKR